MYQASGLMFLYSQTPVQTGAGKGAGTIDMPVQRETATGFPMIYASGVRGAIRQELTNLRHLESVRVVFGASLQEEQQQSGSIAFSDAKILLFPINQPNGVFAWITCPLALRRIMDDSGIFAGYAIRQMTKMAVPPDNFITLGGSIYDQDSLILGDTLLVCAKKEIKTEGQALLQMVLKELQPLFFAAMPKSGAWQSVKQKFYAEAAEKSAVVLVADEVFADLVCQYTQIEARICMDNATKTAQRGALWREETLPPDMLMYTVVAAAPLCLQNSIVPDGLGKGDNAQNVLLWLKNSLTSQYLQIGSGETMGRGFFAAGCGW